MSQYFPLAAITDEFSPDIEKAVQAMAEIGMTGAELRMVFGKNIVDLTDDELNRAIDIVKSRGLEIMSIASPLLKCVLPDAPPVEDRWQQDSFAAKHTMADQPRIAARAFEVAQRTGAKIIRVFSYWRTVRPQECYSRIVEALDGLARQAAPLSLTIGLENEHACNVATGSESAQVLNALNHPNLKLVWDPANAYVAGDTPYPDGYNQIPTNRIGHVHAKDCVLVNGQPNWSELGTQQVDWKGQIAALVRDGYQGWVSLETHWPGPAGDKFQASVICGRTLKAMVTTA